MSRSVLALLFAPVVPLVVLGWMFGGVEFALGALMGYVPIPTVALFGFRKWRLKFQEKIQVLALDRLMRHGLGSNDEDRATVKTLESTAQKAPFEVKVYAFQQMARLGFPEVEPILEKFMDDDDIRVPVAAEEAIKNLKKVMSGDHLLSASQLPVFIDEAEYWHRQYYSRRGLERRESEERQAELVAIINDIVDSQMLLRQSYPDLLCSLCHTRAEEHNRGRWTYVLCRHCGDVMHLKRGIEKVVGCIGNFPPEKEENGVLFLAVWNGTKRKAMYADMDQLLIEGGTDLNYDWAVSAVVAQIQEHEGEGAEELEVVLRNDPPLDNNSLNLLREIGWKE
jgi:hypothetical protein